MKKQKLKGVWLTEHTHMFLKQAAAKKGISIHEYLEKIIQEARNAEV